MHQRDLWTQLRFAHSAKGAVVDTNSDKNLKILKYEELRPGWLTFGALAI